MLGNMHQFLLRYACKNPMILALMVEFFFFFKGNGGLAVKLLAKVLQLVSGGLGFKPRSL